MLNNCFFECLLKYVEKATKSNTLFQFQFGPIRRRNNSSMHVRSTTTIEEMRLPTVVVFFRFLDCL